MINFLTGLDVQGNIDLNSNEIKEVVIDNLTADPTGTDGRIYYNTTSNLLRFYNGSTWLDLSTGADANTTYELFGVGSTNGTAGIQLDGSDGTLDDVLIVGAGTTSVTRAGGTGNTLTVTSNDQYDGTVTSVAATHGGNAFTAAIGNTATINPSVNITMAGAATDYINGLGNIVALSTLPSGSWTLDATTGTPQTIASGDTATFVGGTGIATSIQGTDQVTITNTLPFNSLTLAGSSGGTDSTIVNSGTINIIAGANITALGNGSGGVTVSYTGGTGTMSSFIAKGDSGNNQTITNGNTLFLKSGSYMSTVGQAVGSDIILLNAEGTEAATASKLVARDASGYGYVVTPASGDSSTKIATTAFVQAAVTGLLEFKGGFNASTGAIVGGGNLTSGGSRVAVEVGDYYVVTAAGNFFANAATPLTIGDSVIVQTAASVGTSVEADFIVVQSDTDLATLSTVGIGNVNAGTGIGVAYVSGTATVTNSSPNVDQNIWATFTATTGTTTANTTTDTLSVFGLGSITTSIAGDTLSISGVDTTYNAMTTSILGLGKLSYSVGSTPAAEAQTFTALRTYGITKNASDQLVVNVPWTDNNTTYSMMTSTVLGLGKLEDNTTQTIAANTVSATASRTYGIQKNSSNQLVVNVPWTDNNTTYSQATEAVLGIIKLSSNALALAGTDDLTAITPSVLASTTYTQLYPSSITNTWTIASSSHGLGNGPFVIQTYNASTGAQVFIKTTAAPSTGVVTMTTTSNQSINSIRVVMMKVW